MYIYYIYYIYIYIYIYIALDSNSALKQNADYLLFAIDEDLDVKWAGEYSPRVNKNKYETT